MNPEFQRNLWLELTPRRLTVMVLLLGLAFFAAALSGGEGYGPAAVARWLYYAIVVVWGTRNAALSIIGEIRERTWDSQLLSSIDPTAMVWGKLFGATSYNWFGGFICLAVMLSDTLAHKGLVPAFVDLVYFLSVGVIAQAAALLASLIAIRRRQMLSRLDTFFHQLFGLLAAFAVYSIWSIADPAGFVLDAKLRTDVIPWWGQSLDAHAFLLMSLAIFAGWILIACYREMRLELKMRNGPLVWASFLVFIGLYVAGFDAWLSTLSFMTIREPTVWRLALAATTFWLLSYAMILLEPKDRVLYRRLGSLIASGRIGAALGGLQAWMMSYAATLAVSAMLLASLQRYLPSALHEQTAIASMLGFLTRDIAIFVFMQTLPGRRRGDFAALGILLALYVLIPAIIRGLGLTGALVLFYTQDTTSWFGPAVAWAEGLAFVVIASGRLALSSRPVPATA